jgi:predicted DNA-binding transcriptional regulator AlpA
MDFPKERLWLSDVECARRFGVSRQTWWVWSNSGRGPRPVRFSRGVTRWNLREVEAFEARCREVAE